MEILTYRRGDMEKQEPYTGGALVFYRVEDANVFLHFVRELRGREVDVRATVEQIPVRFEGDGERNVYRVAYELFTGVKEKA